MSKYVDIETLTEALCNKCVASCEVEGGLHCGLQEFVDSFPTVDAVSVVRCKDCKFLTDGKCFFTTTPKDPDDYCSLGEKVKKYGMKKFFVLSRRGSKYHRIVEAEDLSKVADNCDDSCYGIIEISQDEVAE